MKTPLHALAVSLALAFTATAPAQELDPLPVWQRLVEAEVALTIEKDLERAEQLLANVSAMVGRVGDDGRRAEIEKQLVELTAALQNAKEDEETGPSLREWLLIHLGKRDFTTIRDAGSSASRSVADMLAERAYPSPDVESSAIDALIYGDPGAGVALAGRLIDRKAPGDMNLAARLVKAYVESNSVVEMRDGSRRWADPRWRDLLVALLADPDVSRDADAATTVGQTVEHTISFRVVDEILVDAVIEALPRLPEQSALLTGRSVRGTPDVIGAIDEAMLRTGSPDEAAFAAERLALRDDATPLAAFDEHADVRVRREVARSLTKRRDTRNVVLVPPYTPRQRGALARLVTDADVTTRALATRGAVGAPDALTKETWLALATDAELDVRVEVAQFPFGHAWTRDVLVAVIEASDEPVVARTVDGRLRTAEAVVPCDVIDARLTHRSQPCATVSPDDVDRIRGRMWWDVPAFVTWYVNGDEVRARRHVASMVTLGRNPDLIRVSDRTLADFYARVWTATDGNAGPLPLEAFTDVALALALDESLPWTLRWDGIAALSGRSARQPVQALPSVERRRDLTFADRRDVFTAIISDPASAQVEGAPNDVRWLLTGEDGNRMILAAWTNDGPPEHPLLAASLSIAESHPRAVELAERIVELGDACAEGVRLTAIAVLIHHGRASDELVDEVLMTTRDEHFLEKAAAVVARSPDPDRFSSLAKLLTDDGIDRRVAEAALFELLVALGQAGTRPALDILLTVAESGPSMSLREMALENAYAVREHIDAVEHFEADGAAPATRDSARTELVTLLDGGSPAQRAEAARGLATLGAIEELPRLIRLLDDEDAQVRTAVREALDRLHLSGDA